MIINNKKIAWGLSTTEGYFSRFLNYREILSRALNYRGIYVRALKSVIIILIRFWRERENEHLEEFFTSICTSLTWVVSGSKKYNAMDIHTRDVLSPKKMSLVSGWARVRKIKTFLKVFYNWFLEISLCASA